MYVAIFSLFAAEEKIFNVHICLARKGAMSSLLRKKN
jgi:hypothetical protein